MLTPFNYFDHDRSREFAAGKVVQTTHGKPVFEGGDGEEQHVLQQHREMHRLIPQAWPPVY